jgi:hypothetical protein
MASGGGWGPLRVYPPGMATDLGVQGLKNKIIKRAQGAMTLTAVELRTQLREATPKNTGKTSRGWYATPPTFDGSSISFRIRHPQDGSSPAASPRPEWLSSGTAPHVIRAVNARVLAFPGGGGGTMPTKTGGAMVFAKQVFHPGFRGTGFIERTLSQDNVAQVLRRAFQQTP